VIAMLKVFPDWFTPINHLLGGATFCLYPIGISHACDRVSNNQLVSATQTLLLAYGMGATLGPIVAPLFNMAISGYGALIFIVAMTVPLCFFILWRKQTVPSAPEADRHDFVFVTELTPITNEMDPRADEEKIWATIFYFQCRLLSAHWRVPSPINF